MHYFKNFNVFLKYRTILNFVMSVLPPNFHMCFLNQRLSSHILQHVGPYSKICHDNYICSLQLATGKKMMLLSIVRGNQKRIQKT